MPEGYSFFVSLSLEFWLNNFCKHLLALGDDPGWIVNCYKMSGRDPGARYFSPSAECSKIHNKLDLGDCYNLKVEGFLPNYLQI